MKKARVASLVAFFLAVQSVSARDRNLWEWMNVAPIVAVVEIREASSREALVDVQGVLLGDVADASRIALDVRGANRERPEGVPALDIHTGATYLALLEPAPKKRRDGDDPPRFRLVRGVEGLRELPAEGAPAWIAAASRVAEIRALRNDLLIWEALGALLSDANPILVRTALGAHVQFGRGGPGLFPSLLPLLSHPSPDVRIDAATVAGNCIRRDRAAASSGEGREVVLQLVAEARRDPEPSVRAAATRSLAEVGDEASLRVLREIAETDPEQSVRFEAERILYEANRGAPERHD